MENLTLIGQDKFCRYYKTPNHFKTVERLVLKEYITGDGIAMRTLAVFTKRLARKEIINNTEESSQGRIIALSEITEEDCLVHMGKVLFVRHIDKIPISFILSGGECFLFSDKIIKFKEAADILKEWLILHNQYNINPGHFLLDAIQRTLSVAEIIDEYFKSRNLKLFYFKINLGMEIDEETGKVVPVWIGEGIIPQTAAIFEGGKLIKDSKYLAKRILPDNIYKKEIEEMQ